MTYPHPGVDAWESFKEERVPIEIKWFYADWCGPCKMMRPIITKVAESSDAVSVTIINVDQDGNTAANAGVYAVPTTCFHKDGALAYTHIGMMSAASIESEIIKLKEKP